MVRKVVTVDEGLHLPPAVQTQLKADLDAEFSAYVTDAENAASSADLSAQSATASQAAAELAAAEAQQIVVGDADSVIATLVDDVSSETRGALNGAYATVGNLQALADTSATTEDFLIAQTIVPAGVTLSNAAASSFPVFVAHIPLRIISVSMTTWTGSAIATSDTAYWRAEIRKQTPAQVVTTIANKTTRVTASGGTLPAGSALTPRAPWTFDTAQFTNADLAAGEVFAFALYPTGTPTALGPSIVLTVGYKAL